MRHPVSIALALAATMVVAGHARTRPADPAIARAVAAPDRSPADRARDRWRHPAETLRFFGVTARSRIVEFSPGGGWYAQILSRIPGPGGSYTGLVSSPKGAETFTKLLAERGLKGDVAILDAAAGTSTIPAGSADIVLTFRNVHNLMMNDNPAVAANAFRAWYAMLRPGGILGVVDHRLPEARDTAHERTSGYLKRSTVVRLAEGAGFRLAGESAINANPRDTADHPAGVWTLPPTLRLKDVDRDKYAAIGESDRMTLKFVKH